MMDIYERLKSYEPLFGEYELVEFIGGGSFGWVYKVRQISRPASLAALKVIPVPSNEYELHIMESEFPQRDLLREQIKRRMAKQIEEINALEMFEGNTHIVSYKLSSVRPYEDGMGYDILILMEYLQSLAQYLREHEIGEADVIRLGVDICQALESMRKKNMLHRDIKPQNIFYNEISGFKLGDFGISHSYIQEFYSSTAGTKIYAAPEIIKAEKIEAGDNRSDIYSLGLLMYQLLNDNRLPFESDECDHREAFQRRVAKEPFPVIENVDAKLLSIINKACAYDRNDRFANEIEMRGELEALRGNNAALSVKTGDSQAPAGVNDKRYWFRKILPAVGLCLALAVTLITAIIMNGAKSGFSNSPTITDPGVSVTVTTAADTTVAQVIDVDTSSATDDLQKSPSSAQISPDNTPTISNTPTSEPASTAAQGNNAETGPTPAQGNNNPTHPTTGSSPAVKPTPTPSVNTPVPHTRTPTPPVIERKSPAPTAAKLSNSPAPTAAKPSNTPTPTAAKHSNTPTPVSVKITPSPPTPTSTPTPTPSMTPNYSPTPTITAGSQTPTEAVSQTPTPSVTIPPPTPTAAETPTSMPTESAAPTATDVPPTPTTAAPTATQEPVRPTPTATEAPTPAPVVTHTTAASVTAGHTTSPAVTATTSAVNNTDNTGA